MALAKNNALAPLNIHSMQSSSVGSKGATAPYFPITEAGTVTGTTAAAGVGSEEVDITVVCFPHHQIVMPLPTDTH